MTDISKLTNLKAAIEYIKKDWPVFPLKPGEKTPIVKGGFKSASTDPMKIQRWWAKEPKANIGVATGTASGFFVVDIDGPEGSGSLKGIENEIGPLPETLEQMTGREDGGRQLFFQLPVGRAITNKTNVRPGIDVRGTGGYIVVPPSVHPSGKAYNWPFGADVEISKAPPSLLDLIAPKKKRIAPWEKDPEAETRKTVKQAGNSIIERAALYLQECEPAKQGAGGHNAALWAARALVVGFQLSDGDARDLLWSVFNPRCDPPWDRENPSDRKDFERKIAEARSTPGEKPRGWLLDEFGLRSQYHACKSDATPKVDGLFAKIQQADQDSRTTPKSVEVDGHEEKLQRVRQRRPFPVEKALPPKLADYCFNLAEAHCVDRSICALPMYGVLAAATGNMARLQLKKGFVVPPTLWVAIVMPSGSNKSGPLREITNPLHAPINTQSIDSMLCPAGRLLISDATVEAVIAVLGNAPRGLMVYRNELAGWTKSFNAYKNSGGDEQSWIEFWDAHEYLKDRKSDDEPVNISAASVCVLGGVQPKVFLECCDPGRFASGLVPRLLIACPPDTGMYWTEAEVSEEQTKMWADAVMWIRTRPFSAFDPTMGRFAPHVLKLTREAKDLYVDFFNRVSGKMSATQDEFHGLFASKARVMAARFAICHRMGYIATETPDHPAELTKPIPANSMAAGIAAAKWCLEEQLRVYGYSAAEYSEHEVQDALGLMKRLGGKATTREIQRTNVKKFKKKTDVKDKVIDVLVRADLAEWDGRYLSLIQDGDK